MMQLLVASIFPLDLPPGRKWPSSASRPLGSGPFCGFDTLQYDGLEVRYGWRSPGLKWYAELGGCAGRKTARRYDLRPRILLEVARPLSPTYLTTV
jgi:hypothetical protein